MERQKRALICVNRDFLATRNYPRQKGKFRRTLDLLNQDGVGADVLQVEFRGKSSEEVIDNIAHQLRDHMAMLFDGTTVALFGDSGLCPVIHAVRKNLRENPISNDSNLRPNPLYVGPCGTMETLARTMRMDTAERVAGVMRGEIPHEIQDILIREVTMDTYEGEKLLRSKTAEWMLFCGTGLDGEIIKLQESKPRSRPVGVNLAHTGWQTLMSVLDKKRGPVMVDSVMTLPFYGPFHLDMEKYNRLNSGWFYKIAFSTERGLSTLPRFMAYNLMGLDPRISETIWEDLYGLSEIPDSIKPEFVTDHRVVIYPDDQDLHIDSFPEDLHLEDGQHAVLTFSTVEPSSDSVVQVVKAGV